MLITRKWAMPNGQTFVIEEMERPAGDSQCTGAADTSEEDIDKALAYAHDVGFDEGYQAAMDEIE